MAAIRTITSVTERLCAGAEASVKRSWRCGGAPPRVVTLPKSNRFVCGRPKDPGPSALLTIPYGGSSDRTPTRSIGGILLLLAAALWSVGWLVGGRRRI